MTNIPVKKKIQLGMLLGEGHRKFGKVAPRRPYYEKEEDGGTGSAQNLFESHPLLANMPNGAPSDLTFLIEQNGRNITELEKREDQACLQLQKTLENVLRHGYKPPAVLTPYTA